MSLSPSILPLRITPPAMTHRMGEDRADRLADRHRAEFHAAASLPVRAAAAQRLDHLCQDGDGDLGRRLRPDGKADRSVDAGERGLSSKPSRAQAFEPLAVGLPAAERANIEAVRP